MKCEVIIVLAHPTYVATDPQAVWGDNWLKKIRLRPFTSGRVQSCPFIKQLWVSQTSEDILLETKVVRFEILMLKSAINKIKIRYFLTKLKPS
jgi:hypothetical protein